MRKLLCGVKVKRGKYNGKGGKKQGKRKEVGRKKLNIQQTNKEGSTREVYGR